MKTAKSRRLDRSERKVAPAPEIDPSGLDPQALLVEMLKHHSLASLLKDLPPLQMTKPPPPTTDATDAVPEPKVAVEPAPPKAPPNAPSPPQAAQPALWWEEYIGRPKHGPYGGYDDEVRYETIHEYDPLAEWDDPDNDPPD
jgi:hypothetical protein